MYSIHAIRCKISNTNLKTAQINKNRIYTPLLVYSWPLYTLDLLLRAAPARATEDSNQGLLHHDIPLLTCYHPGLNPASCPCFIIHKQNKHNFEQSFSNTYYKCCLTYVIFFGALQIVSRPVK